MTMRRLLMAAMLTGLFGRNPVLAQVGGIGGPTPGIGATSPLGMAPGSPVAPPGIPMGATELAPPGLSPAPTACSGSSTNFDGGGMTAGSGTSLPGAAAPSTCGTTAGGSGASSASTLPVTPGGVARTGIPMGSVEIDNGGLSPLLAVPAPCSTAGSFSGC